jgi:outer membrane receptor for ferrienterochelin and colicins
MRLCSLYRPSAVAAALMAVGSLVLPSRAAAQATGGVSGTVTRADDGSVLAGVVIRVNGTQITASSNPNGKYVLQRIPIGAQTLVFRWVGYAPKEVAVNITAGGMATVDVKLEPMPVTLAEVVVSGASRAPERVTEAPAAITQVDPRALTTASINGQAPLALRNVPGIDIAQSGLNDFNVNARGFNSTLNRRVLVLQDGRDLAIAFLGAQEWNTLTQPTEDISKMEFVSGPGSALYGANAFSGVLDITTPTAREVTGTKVTVGGGFLGGPSTGWNNGSPAAYRADIRQAGVFSQGRFGYRVNLGWSSSDTWTRSRTLKDGTALQQEYADATDSLVAKASAERRALSGQTIDPTTGDALGDRDPVKAMYGSGRLDYYLADGSVLTAEGGAANVKNEVFVTGIGRVQVTNAMRPWGRLNWASTGFNVMAYWNGRRTSDPQYSLASGAPLLEHADIYHVEGQGNATFSDGRGKFVYGGSLRNTRLNTDSTLMLAKNDDRSDYMYAAFAQFSWKLSDIARMVLAARYDLGSLIDPQFSPKAALILTPKPNQSIRFTINHAFQTPNYSEYFLRAQAGIADLSALEAGLRASALGPALAGVPNGQLFACTTYTSCTATSALTPIVARGNNKLGVEKNTGFEIGYKGDLTRRVYLSADLYYNLLSNFVTDLLPGVNSAFKFWTSPTAVPAPYRPALEATVKSQLLAVNRTAGLGLSREESGNTAIVVSYANAGSAKQWGADIGAGWQISEEFGANATLALFNYSVNTDEIAAGDKVLANTPKWRTVLSFSYAGRQGFDAGLSYRYSSAFPWAAGVFNGWIDPGHNIDGNVGYKINNNFKVFMTGTNLFNHQWFSVYGGSVTGRRVMGGATATF